MADDNKIELSRRKVLGSLGLIGGAGAFAGAGTYALFSDHESAVVSFMSGKLDLTVHYESTYYGAEKKTDSGTIRGGQEMLFNRTDLKPGDHGKTRFCFELLTNPAYLWLCGDITADGEGSSHSQLEKDAGDETPNDGELDEAIKATLRYCDSNGNPINGDTGIIEDGTLGEVLAALENGIPLDYDGNGDASAQSRAPYQPSSSSGGTTGPCVCIDWEIPKEDVDDEIQTDKLEFSLMFHAVQARHNDGTGSPCGVGNGGCSNCVKLGKVEEGEVKDGPVQMQSSDGTTVEIELSVNETDNTFDFDVVSPASVDICKVGVKGGGSGSGGGTKTYDYTDDPVSSGDNLHPPVNPQPAPGYFGISHIVFHYCND